MLLALSTTAVWFLSGSCWPCSVTRRSWEPAWARGAGGQHPPAAAPVCSISHPQPQLAPCSPGPGWLSSGGEQALTQGKDDPPLHPHPQCLSCQRQQGLEERAGHPQPCQHLSTLSRDCSSPELSPPIPPGTASHTAQGCLPRSASLTWAELGEKLRTPTTLTPTTAKNNKATDKMIQKVLEGAGKCAVALLSWEPGKRRRNRS